MNDFNPLQSLVIFNALREFADKRAARRNSQIERPNGLFARLSDSLHRLNHWGLPTENPVLEDRRPVRPQARAAA